MRIATILFCLYAVPAAAIVFGGTNLGLFGYPEPNCSQPFKLFEFTDEWERDQFISEVESYMSCVREYVDNANNDVKRVIEARDNAIDEANRYVDSL